jgi:TonB family protein
VQGPPPIDFTPKIGAALAPSAPTCIVCRSTTGRLADVVGGGDAHGGGADEPRAWSAGELLMRIVTPAIPRYPERLRVSSIEGSVTVQFTVDTTGRVDMSSVKILASSHPLFADAVRDALARFRFRPAEMGGHRVPALAQMPFEFRLK